MTAKNTPLDSKNTAPGRSVFNESIIYGIGIFMSHATSIIMLPIYTRFLSPADYGMADLLAMGVEIAGLIVGVVSADAIFRFYHNDEFKNKNQVATSIFFTAIFVNCIGYLLILGTSSKSAQFIFSDMNVEDAQRLILLYGCTLIFQVMSNIPMAYLRAEKKPVHFVVFSFARLAIAVSCNLYFVVYRELHITGVVYAVFTFTLIHSCMVTAYMLSRTGLAFSRRIAFKSLVFSAPLMLSSLALFFITYADRLFIKHYVSVSELGLYALGYKFGFILVAFAWVPFAQSWEGRRYEVAKSNNPISTFQQTFRITQAIVIFCALGLALFSKDVLRIIAAPEFHSAHKIIGIVVFAHIFNIWTAYCIFGIFYRQKTIYKAYVDWISLPLTMLIYYLLIPRYGAMGAAWATAASLGFRFLLIYAFSNKLYDMRLQWSKILPGLLVAIILYIFSYSMNFPIITSVAFNALLTTMFVAYLFMGNFLTREDKSLMLKTVGGVASRFSKNASNRHI